jgi:hypothetical protein
MTRSHIKRYDVALYKKALNNLLKRKSYHIAPPTKKNKMFLAEYIKVLNKEKNSNTIKSVSKK